jgi:hypothetical protein
MDARRFKAPQRMQVVVAAAAIRREPRSEAKQLDQLLLGERFDVLELRDGHAWGQAVRTVMWATWPMGPGTGGAAPNPLGEGPADLRVRRSSIKSRPTGPTPEQPGGGHRTGGSTSHCDAGFWIQAHLALGEVAEDPAVIVGRRRAWGPPTSGGGREGRLDWTARASCSRLLLACGRAMPAGLRPAAGRWAPPAVAARPGAGGPGVLARSRRHAGGSGARMVHANAHHMAVAQEPLKRRSRESGKSGGGEPTAYRRPLARTRPEAA